MELLAPLLLAFLFVVFGMSYRRRGGCDACPGKSECPGHGGCLKDRERSG